ncbi:unnamed protein product [Aphanomyces euteiches]|uniref:WD repeat-containing protein 7 n=1 Tax=Aphanomyces euteiches TaxID=100861 RepID=A0A6G0X907_9STRA|nr:hypothetical protein Ae201684_007500 [Aphanomyces euteiches]KAH9156806.1 hypothetical protein AeRB84_001302 [Aphanomyces euteiches]
MDVPVVVWSNCSMKNKQLKFTCSCAVVSHDSTSFIMVSGTENGVLLLFRAPSQAEKWQLDCLLVRHSSPIAGLAMGVNEWGDYVCISVDVDGALGIWHLQDGRCIDWKQTIATELAPILGIQLFCNQRYALVYGEQGRMLMVDIWNCSVLACAGTGLEQGRRDVGVGECVYNKLNKQIDHQIDSKVIVLGMEGLCKIFNWSQPIPVSSDNSPVSTSTNSFMWHEDSTWIISWAQDTDDLSCIHTRINPQTNFVHYSHFPIHVFLSPNASLVLLLWRTKWAVFHRMWLDAGTTDSTLHPTFCPSSPDFVDWAGGCFVDNDTILLWTVDHKVYSFPALVSDKLSSTGQVFVFQPQDNTEVPQSIAFTLAGVEIPSTPFLSLPRCGCSSTPLVVDTPGHITAMNTVENGLVLSFVGRCGCSLLWHPKMTTAPNSLVPLDGETENNDKAFLTASHVVFDQGKNVLAPLLIHGFSNGRVELHVQNTVSTLETKDTQSCVTCISHLSVTRAVKPAAALYESYADSPTQGMGFQSAKLTKISHLLHKLQHHSLTPKSHQAPTTPTFESPRKEEQLNLCLVFTGNRRGDFVVSQLASNDPSTWRVIHKFARHTQSITAIYVSPTPSTLGTIVASVGADRKVSLFAVRIDDGELHVEFLMDCMGHADRVLLVEWAFQTNHIFIECADGMMYIWSLTTRILERIVPKVMVHYASSPSRSSSPLPNVHVFPCSVQSLSTALAANNDCTLLSYLHTWDDDPHLDDLITEALGLVKPQLAYCVAMTGAQEAMTLPLRPSNGQHGAKWQYSSHLSAQLALALVALCTSLMETSSQEDQIVWSQLITQIAVVLPERLPHYREPSLEALADFGFHPWETCQTASRLLLNGVIKRLPDNLRSTKAAAYMAKFQVELQQLDKQPGGWSALPMDQVVAHLGSHLVVLSILGTCFPGEISPTCARQVCDVLVACLVGPSHVAVVAAELLAKGLLLFRPHLTDVGQLILQLIPLTLDEDPSKQRLKQAAMRLLVEVGTCEASFVLSILQQEMNVSDRSIAYREGVLVYLMTWVNTQYQLMVRHLPAVIDAILTCLDPTKPDRRKKCLAMSTKCLHDLVKRFPMVDFHKTTQRLAVGTMDGVILLYDLRMATKWRVLEGHTTSVGAVSFRKDGGMLISYGAREAMVRWWNISGSGLFTLLKVQQSCVRHLQLASIQSRPADFRKVIQTCRFRVPNEDTNDNTVWLTREDESVLPLNFHI